MPKVEFTGHLRRYMTLAAVEVDGATVRTALDAVFALEPRLRSYVVDEQGALRTHVNIFVNGQPVADRARLSDAVGAADEIYILQALSGGRMPVRSAGSALA
jgi:molybdopterin converting factor small subunit